MYKTFARTQGARRDTQLPCQNRTFCLETSEAPQCAHLSGGVMVCKLLLVSAVVGHTPEKTHTIEQQQKQKTTCAPTVVVYTRKQVEYCCESTVSEERTHWVWGRTWWVLRETRWVPIGTQIIGQEEITEFSPPNFVSAKKLTGLSAWNRTLWNRTRPVSEIRVTATWEYPKDPAVLKIRRDNRCAMRSKFTIAEWFAIMTPLRRHCFPWVCTHLSSQRRVHGVVPLGTKTLPNWFINALGKVGFVRWFKMISLEVFLAYKENTCNYLK